jgi:putative membrane protein
MDYMFEAGFLGTRAPFFMDIVTLIVAILPLLVYGSVLFVRKQLFKTHMITQNIIFIVSVIVLGYFEYGVRIGGGFNAFINDTGVSHNYALWVLILHVVIAGTTLVFWILTIAGGNYNFAKKDLPGRYALKHRVHAIKTVLGIILTSFTGIWVYLLLFVY